MSKWIASRIMDAKDKNGLAAAQQKYKLYFLMSDKMQIYKADTDAILEQEGYADCIVSEEE